MSFQESWLQAHKSQQFDNTLRKAGYKMSHGEPVGGHANAIERTGAAIVSRMTAPLMFVRLKQIALFRNFGVL